MAQVAIAIANGDGTAMVARGSIRLEAGELIVARTLSFGKLQTGSFQQGCRFPMTGRMTHGGSLGRCMSVGRRLVPAAIGGLAIEEPSGRVV